MRCAFVAFLLVAMVAEGAIAGPPIDPPAQVVPAAPADPAEKVPPPPPLLDAPSGTSSATASASSSTSNGPTPVPSALAREWEERIGMIGGIAGASLALGTVLVLYGAAASQEGVGQDAQIGMGVAAGLVSLYAAYLGAAGGVVAGSAVGALVDASARPAP